jgi:hypothetical protein
MRRFRILATVAVIVVLAVALTGWTFAQASAHDFMMVGVVVAEENVALEVEDQVGAESEIAVSRVLAPDDSWIVVHLDEGGMPGKRVGLLRVEEGESLDLVVPLDEQVTTPNVIVALHADRGQRGVFEFDMDAFMHSPDKPYFVDFEEVATVVAVADFGVPVMMGEAEIVVDNQAIDSGELLVRRVTAPEGAWVVVHLDDDGMPGMRVGLAAIPAGESTDVRVQIDSEEDVGDALIVAVHADRGVAGEFEFDMDDAVGSPDQPYFVDGMEVATVVDLTP